MRLSSYILRQIALKHYWEQKTYPRKKQTLKIDREIFMALVEDSFSPFATATPEMIRKAKKKQKHTVFRTDFVIKGKK